MVEPIPEERGQSKKLKEIVENMNKLDQDMKDLKEAFADILKVQESSEELLKCIISHLDIK